MGQHTTPFTDFHFQRHPESYRHLKLSIEGAVARLNLDIQEGEGLREGYSLKLNSYDLGVDIELADAVQRLRFEHPEVTCVVISSAIDGCFSSGANIFMLGQSSHAWKVNFCKYTNETRLYIEDATANSGQTYIAALNGVASGGGYELPLACEKIYLIDDRRSAVSLPEVPYLGVLPGTGGITRVTDKRKVRRDLADVFMTLAEGIKGKRAKQWGLVDDVFRRSAFDDEVNARAAEIADGGRPDRVGVALKPIAPEVDERSIRYDYVTLEFSDEGRVGSLTMHVPADLPQIPSNGRELGCDWWGLKAWREFDDALLRLRFHYPQCGVVTLHTRGSAQDILAFDHTLLSRQDDWFVREVTLHIRRVLKRLDVTSKTFFALVDDGSSFAGSLMELALAADRIYALDEEGIEVQLGPVNRGVFPMGNGISRLASRFLGSPESVTELLSRDKPVASAEAEEVGLVTFAYDELDWDDEIRMAVEERASLSPDALTGMESNIRFAGPETLETKIFGRLSAWQNWIFQRDNAVGAQGALTLYGRPETARFNFDRT
ncbi:MAG: 2,3-epoxybenzoyl-CoA dihydrolase [Myxococcota bacterium]|nr:2,3-epoxybenzoyl-CoA dihydrolase [Myxococcota bacterium]